VLREGQPPGLKNENSVTMRGICCEKMLYEHTGERPATNNDDVEGLCIGSHRCVCALESFIEPIAGITA
jgi:hypothetical protein